MDSSAPYATLSRTKSNTTGPAAQRALRRRRLSPTQTAGLTFDIGRRGGETAYRYVICFMSRRA